MGDIQSGHITEGFRKMKEPKIHRPWVTKWAIIEENRFYAPIVHIGGHS